VQEAERMYEDVKRVLFKLDEINRSTKQKKYEAKYRACSSELQRLQRDLQHASLVTSTLPSRDDDIYADDYQVSCTYAIDNSKELH
jgi:hypothetical protein